MNGFPPRLDGWPTVRRRARSSAHSIIRPARRRRPNRRSALLGGTGAPDTLRQVDPWSLDGLSFSITGIVDDGVHVRLVEGSLPTVTFSNHGLRVETGCNSLNGPYEINSGGYLVANPLVKTLRGCGKALSRQEERIAGVFSSSPLVELSGGTLRLRSGRVVIEAVPA